MIYSASLIGGILLASLVENILHRFYLHRKKNHTHILLHHKTFNGKKSFDTPDVPKKEIISAPGYIMANILLYMPAGLLLSLIDLKASIIFMTAGVSYTLWLEWVHLKFHRRGESFFEKTRTYSSLKEHHKKHHIDYKNNFSIGSVWWDYLLNTEEKRTAEEM